ncbi:MAG: hypothetical protein CME65_11595 [Halobacteriovoraceae bacterium]|nr:hypothetical protein [Halobacteriovoraceae bacterium]|tara:strand:- start:22450 stop:23376 length:927 start_codon:yes stop_codon:yes gene_type:complete
MKTYTAALKEWTTARSDWSFELILNPDRLEECLSPAFRSHLKAVPFHVEYFLPEIYLTQNRPYIVLTHLESRTKILFYRFKNKLYGIVYISDYKLSMDVCLNLIKDFPRKIEKEISLVTSIPIEENFSNIDYTCDKRYDYWVQNNIDLDFSDTLKNAYQYATSKGFKTEKISPQSTFILQAIESFSASKGFSSFIEPKLLSHYKTNESYRFEAFATSHRDRPERAISIYLATPQNMIQLWAVDNRHQYQFGKLSLLRHNLQYILQNEVPERNLKIFSLGHEKRVDGTIIVEKQEIKGAYQSYYVYKFF